MDNQEKQEPTITLTLTAAETAVLLNSAAFTVSLLMCQDRSAAVATIHDTVGSFEDLGAENYDALSQRICQQAMSAFGDKFDAIGYNRTTGEEKSLSVEGAAA